MRRYNIIFGIILMLSVIDIALPAPLSAQEKRQERVDAVHILPKEEITVLGKRFIEDLGKLLGMYSKTGEEGVESSSSALLGPDHGSTNVVQPPAPGPTLSTANPGTSKKSSSCWGNCLGLSWSDVWAPLRDDPFNLRYDGLRESLYTPEPSYGSGWGRHGISGYSWHPPPQQKLYPELIPKPDPKPNPLISPEADPDFDWEHWINAPDRPSPPAKEANMYKVDPLSPPSTSGHAPSPPLGEPDPEAATPSPPSSNLGSPKEPDYDVVSEPPQSPDPELHLDHQSLGADSQPVDLQAAIYAAKGKAKESRHISGTARDVGNAAQRGLQPVEGSLDPGDLTVRDLGNL